MKLRLSDNISLKNFSKVKSLSIILVLITSLVIAVFILQRTYSKNSVPATSQDKNSSLLKTTPIVKLETKPNGYARVVLPKEASEHYQIYLTENTSGNSSLPDAQHLIYFPEGQKIVIPSLLGSYEFFSCHNFHSSYQGYSLGGAVLTKAMYGEATSAETQKLNLFYYQSENNGYWATAKIKESEFKEFSLDAGFIFHALTKQKLEEMIELVDKEVEVNDFPSLGFSTEAELPPRQTFTTNYVEPKGKYRFYLPAGYHPITYEDKWRNWTLNFGGNQKEEICLSLKGVYDREVCGFSTSGCTCCNTGCQLVDIAFFADPSGSLRLSGVLDKGGGLGWIRFLYGEDSFIHPWLYYSASYSSGVSSNPEEANYQNYKKGILDFLHLVESIERTY